MYVHSFEFFLILVERSEMWSTYLVEYIGTSVQCQNNKKKSRPSLNSKLHFLLKIWFIFPPHPSKYVLGNIEAYFALDPFSFHVGAISLSRGAFTGFSPIWALSTRKNTDRLEVKRRENESLNSISHAILRYLLPSYVTRSCFSPCTQFPLSICTMTAIISFQAWQARCHRGRSWGVRVPRPGTLLRRCCPRRRLRLREAPRLPHHGKGPGRKDRWGAEVGVENS